MLGSQELCAGLKVQLLGPAIRGDQDPVLPPHWCFLYQVQFGWQGRVQCGPHIGEIWRLDLFRITPGLHARHHNPLPTHAYTSTPQLHQQHLTWCTLSLKYKQVRKTMYTTLMQTQSFLCRLLSLPPPRSRVTLYAISARYWFRIIRLPCKQKARHVNSHNSHQGGVTKRIHNFSHALDEKPRREANRQCISKNNHKSQQKQHDMGNQYTVQVYDKEHKLLVMLHEDSFVLE